MLKLLIENKLISSNQSGLKSGDYCINQLFSITHDIYEFFDVKLEVTSVSLHITKTLDKVCHDDIIFKLTQNG